MATTTYYVIYDDGSIDIITTSGSTQPALSKPGHFVTADEYEAAWLVLRQGQYDSTLASLETNVTNAKAVRDGYVALGLPVATADMLSGYTRAVQARDAFVADHDLYMTYPY